MGGQQADTARLLADLSSALTTASTDLERVVQCAARAASELIGDGAVVRLANDAGVFDRAAVYHPDGEAAEMLRRILPGQQQRVDAGFAAEVRRNGGVVVRNDLTEDAVSEIAGPLWSHLRHLRFGAILMVPLIADGTYLGNLSLGRAGRQRPFTEQDTRLAVDVAARVVLAVATARSVAQSCAERENYRLIVQTCSEGVWKIDADGLTTFLNDRMARILGVSVKQMLERRASCWQPEEEPGRWWQLPEKQLHERRLRHEGGHLIRVQLGVSVMPVPAGSPPGTQAEWLIMVTDISDRIRGPELAERLAQMQRLDSIGQLAGGIAHDPVGEHIELRCPAGEEHRAPCRVRMDQGQLHQVIVNLTTNARDAMDAGGRLRIDCEILVVDRAELGRPDLAGDDDGVGEQAAWFVRLAVSDTGTGMDAATLRRAFEPFYTTKAVGHGTGLGLAGVYGIVRAAGGLVVPYSEPGHGTTIKTYLLACDEEPAAQKNSGPADVEGTSPAGTGALRILVVEDNPALAEVMCRLLRPAGYTVTAVYDPHAALALLNAMDIDLVITDVVMPDLTGPELAAEIHRHRPGMPIVYTSGYTAGVLGERAHLEADAIVLEKPFTRAGLVEAIIRALHESPPRNS